MLVRRLRVLNPGLQLVSMPFILSLTAVGPPKFSRPSGGLSPTFESWKSNISGLIGGDAASRDSRRTFWSESGAKD